MYFSVLILYFEYFLTLPIGRYVYLAYETLGLLQIYVSFRNLS